MKFSIITSAYNQLERLKIAAGALEKQTFTDFEWIVADDGSSDGTREWMNTHFFGRILGVGPVKHVYQPDNGYRLTEILNKAAKVATGDYLIWIMGDSYAKNDFLKQLSEVVSPDKMHNGIRLNVDEQGLIVSPDWRADRVLFDPEAPEVEIRHKAPWEAMTLNSMVMPRAAYEKMGGIPAKYKGYGRMDWYMAAWCHYNGIKLYWCPRAIIYHLNHLETPEKEENIKMFEEDLKALQEGSSV